MTHNQDMIRDAANNLRRVDGSITPEEIAVLRVVVDHAFRILALPVEPAAVRPTIVLSRRSIN